MAVQVITGGVFTKDPGARPGLYVRFVEKAIAAISAGSRSKVATVKYEFTGGTAVEDKVYRITNMEQATGLFGVSNIEDIRLFLIGGASEIVVSTIKLAVIPADTNWNKALQALETYDFHVFALPFASSTELDATAFTWLKTCRTNGMNFIAVFADEASEGNVTTLKASAVAKKDEYSVFVGGGVKNPDNTEVSADKYACYIAGLIAGTALDGSLTYHEVPFAETITRYRSTDVKDLLATGILVTTMDGDQPKIEQGLTLGTGQFNKIRTVRAKQAMIDDIDSAVNDNYVGKITNNPDGQIAVINAIKAYLETLSNGNVIAKDYTVILDPTVPSIGAELYIQIGVKFLDSIEYVFMTVTV